MLYETASSHGAHDAAAARGEFLCSGQEFAQRSRAWKEKLSGVIRGADTEHITSQVSQVWVPASGADVLSAFAAFPAAREYTFISREVAVPSTLDGRWHSDSKMAAALRAVFSCSHAGGYLLGHQLRTFADRWGLLPLLLVALAIADVQVLHVQPLGGAPGGYRAQGTGWAGGHWMGLAARRGGQLRHWEMHACVASSSGVKASPPPSASPPSASAAGFTCDGGRRAVKIRYLSLDLGNRSAADSLVARMDEEP